MSYTLQQTINWVKPFIQYSPALQAGTGQEPAVSIATMIRNTILSAPITWPWNRAEASTPVTAGTQDYTMNLTDFGFLEKATLADDQGNTFEVKYTFNNEPLAVATTPQARPNAISILTLTPYTSLKVRLTGVPQSSYTLTLTYQKIAQPFVATDTITSVVQPPAGQDVNASGNSGIGNLSVSASVTPTVSGVTLFGVTAETNTMTIGPNVPAGWTTLNTGSGGISNQYILSTGGTQLSATSSYTASGNYEGLVGVMMNVGTNGSPAFSIVANGITGNLNAGTPYNIGGALIVPAGATLLVAFISLGQAVGSAHIPCSITAFTDNHSNTWYKVAEPVVFSDTYFWAAGVSCWICMNPPSATNYQFTLTGLGASAQNQNFNAYIYSVTNTILTSHNPTYFGSFTAGAYPTGGSLNVAGFTNTGNNGTFPVLTGSQTAITVTNPNAVTETHAATASSYGWAPIPDNYMDVYNNLFMSEAMSLVDDDHRAQMYRQRGVAAFLARAEGLTESQKSAFLMQWNTNLRDNAAQLLRINQGTQARGI